MAGQAIPAISWADPARECGDPRFQLQTRADFQRVEVLSTGSEAQRVNVWFIQKFLDRRGVPLTASAKSKKFWDWDFVCF